MTSRPSQVGADGIPVGPRAHKLQKIIAYAIGLALLAAAVWAVASHDLRGTWGALRGAPAWLVVAAFVLPLLNWFLMSATFSVLIRPFGRVGRGEMAALIGASWLLNYLPMRPGLVGRVAYHKTVNRIPVRDSVKTIAANIGCGIGAFALGSALAVLASSQAGESSGTVLIGAMVVSAVLLATGFTPSRWWGPWATLAPATLFRFFDLMVWAARYWVVFRLVGAPVDISAALAVAVVSQVVSLVPFIGNGFGLREWAVGLTAAALPAWMVDAGSSHSQVGLAADLVNRAAELAGAIPVGLLSVWWLARAAPRRR
jgi:uncharacterized membrane protein YhdT